MKIRKPKPVESFPHNKPYCILCRPQHKENAAMYVAQILTQQFGVVWKCPICGREKAETNKNAMEALLKDKNLKIMENAKIIENQGGGWYGKYN